MICPIQTLIPMMKMNDPGSLFHHGHLVFLCEMHYCISFIIRRIQMLYSEISLNLQI
ncbi:hypothetical protein X975_20953, partial [Stegodyphus mimosarum]